MQRKEKNEKENSFFPPRYRPTKRMMIAVALLNEEKMFDSHARLSIDSPSSRIMNNK